MTTNPPGYLKKYYKKWKKEITEQLGGKCFTCGKTRNLEIHHTKGWKGKKGSGRGRGMLARLTDWKRHPEDLRLYCTPCHDKADLAMMREKRGA